MPSDVVSHEYAWKYFSLHADQRIKTFNFFVVLSTLITSAIVASYKTTSIHNYSGYLGFVLLTISFVFWRLDLRNKMLIKIGEEALKDFEKQLIEVVEGKEPNVRQLFLREEWLTKQLRAPTEKRSFMQIISYSDCFNILFFLFGAGGLFFGCAFFF